MVLQRLAHGLRDISVLAPPVILAAQEPVGIGEPAGPRCRCIGVIVTELKHLLPSRHEIVLLHRGLRIGRC